MPFPFPWRVVRVQVFSLSRHPLMWFTETPWPPILICAVLAACLLAAWHSQRRTSQLAAVVGLALLSLGIFVAERLIVTDREQIEASVHGITRSFQQGKREATLDYISEQAVELRALVSGAFDLVKVEDDLRITDLQVRMVSQNTQGIAHFRANATISVMGHRSRHPSRWEATWQREGDQWRMVRIQRLHPLSGEELNLLDRQ